MGKLADDAEGFPIHFGTYVEVNATRDRRGGKKRHAWVTGPGERPGVLAGEDAGTTGQIQFHANECIVRAPGLFAKARRIGHGKSIADVSARAHRRNRRGNL